MLSFVLLPLLFLTVPPVLAKAVCYSLDGQVLDDTHAPCNPNAEFSACCALNGTDIGENDICLDSGLCQSTSGWFANFLYADGCTDKTGAAAACPSICAHMPKQYAFNVLPCNPGVFCCRASYDTSNCCNNSDALVNTSHIGTLLLPGGAEINTTFNGTTSATTCPANHAGTVGGVTGGILGALLLASLIALAFLLTQRRQLRRDLALASASSPNSHPVSVEQAQQQQYFPKHDPSLVSASSQAPPYQQHYQANNNPSAYSINNHGYTYPNGQPAPAGGVRPVEMDQTQHPSELSNEVVEPKRELSA